MAIALAMVAGAPARAQEPAAANGETDAAGVAEARPLDARDAAANRERLVQLEISNLELKASNERLRQELRAARAVARSFSRMLARRTFGGVSRRIAAMPGSAIPYVGAGVLAGMARLDVREGCETLEELNELNRALNLEPVETARLCTLQVTTSDQILAQVLANWRTAYAVAAARANEHEARLPADPPVVPLAGANQLWLAVFGVNPWASPQAMPGGQASPTAPTPPVPPYVRQP